MKYWNPTLGDLTPDEVVNDIIRYLHSAPSKAYKMIIGTDSQTRGNRSTKFVTAIIVHRLGKGARIYITGTSSHGIHSLRQKIFTEAAMSLETCSWLSEMLQKVEKDLNLEVHIDIGLHGETKALVKEVVGWVTHSGYQAVIKPDSFGASKVADRYARQSTPDSQYARYSYP